MMSKSVRGVITIDIDLRPMLRAFEAVGQALRRFSDSLTPEGRLATRRRNSGGAGDLYGLWQSSPCAGWLHDSCRDPANDRLPMHLPWRVTQVTDPLPCRCPPDRACTCPCHTATRLDQEDQ